MCLSLVGHCVGVKPPRNRSAHESHSFLSLYLVRYHEFISIQHLPEADMTNNPSVRYATIYSNINDQKLVFFIQNSHQGIAKIPYNLNTIIQVPVAS